HTGGQRDRSRHGTYAREAIAIVLGTEGTHRCPRSMPRTQVIARLERCFGGSRRLGSITHDSSRLGSITHDSSRLGSFGHARRPRSTPRPRRYVARRERAVSEPDAPATVVDEIVAALQARANPDRALGEKRYLKSDLEHWGAGVP